MARRPHQTGFTLIELMIATTLFAVVLIVILASFLQIGKIFYKGVSLNSVHESVRTVVDEISDDIKFAQVQVCAPQDPTGNPAPQPIYGGGTSPTQPQACPYNGPINPSGPASGSKCPTASPYPGKTCTFYFCIGAHRYTYTLFHKMTAYEYAERHHPILA
jgi:prepilin-type N-terminal cleavage/methylation domain-containing protein